MNETLNTINKKKKTKLNAWGYIFVAPAMFFFLMYILYPIIFVVEHSLFSWSTLANRRFVGLDNYATMMHDSIFWKTVKNSFEWILVTVPVQACLGFVFAYIIEERLGRKKKEGKFNIFNQTRNWLDKRHDTCNFNPY